MVDTVDRAAEVTAFLQGVLKDVETNADNISGIIGLVVFKDGTITTGWTGGFDLENTAGRLFNLGVDFSMHAKRMREAN